MNSQVFLLLLQTHIMKTEKEGFVLRCLLVQDSGEAAHVTKSTTLSVGNRYQVIQNNFRNIIFLPNAYRE